MFFKDRYNWETDDSVGQILSGEVDSAISAALSQLSEIKYEYQKQINENQSKLSSIESRIRELCNDTTRYIG